MESVKSKSNWPDDGLKKFIDGLQRKDFKVKQVFLDVLILKTSDGQIFKAKYFQDKKGDYFLSNSLTWESGAEVNLIKNDVNDFNVYSQFLIEYLNGLGQEIVNQFKKSQKN